MSDNEYDPMDPDNDRYGGYDQQQQNHNQYNHSMVPEETKYAGFEQQQQLYVHPTNPVNNAYGEYSQQQQQQQQQQQHFMQTAPMLFQQQTTMPPLPSSAPLAPWLLNSPQIMQQQQLQQSLPPPPTSIQLPPLPSAPLPSAPSMHLPSQPPLPSNIQPPPPYYPPDFQSAPPPPPPSIVPAPPQSIIPPPPPALDDADATDGCDDKDEAYEIAYSPSQAEDEKNVEEVEKDKKVQLAILSSQQKQMDMVNLIRKKEKEIEEHTKRMEMENKKIEDLKKRKMISGFAPIKLQKKKLKGFEEPEGDSTDVISKENSSLGDNKKQITGKKAATENSTFTDNRVISDEKLKLMTQIASYLTNNPNHAAAFTRSKKNEENYEFLHDSERLTNEGRKFREISEKLQAAKNVQNVCGAAAIVSAVNNNDYVTNLNNTIALQMRAVERKDVPAVDYSLLNPFKIDRPPVPAPPPLPTVSQHSNRIQPALQNGASKDISLNDTNNAHNLNSNNNDIKSSNTNSAINNNTKITDNDSSHSNNSNNNNNSSNNSSSSSSNSHSNQVGLHPSSDVIASADPPKSNRRNRWGPTVVPNSVVSSSSIADSITAASSSMMLPAPSPATHIVSSASITADKVRAQQIKEQQEMQLLERRIREAAGQGMIGTHTHTSSSTHDITTGGKVDRSLQQLEELNRERESEYRTLAARYNADDTKDTVHDAERNRGIIDGGTWEHRKRAKEMLETAEKNNLQSLAGRGSHFMGDFLPKKELDKFLKNADTIVSGLKVEKESDYEDKKILSDNIGFQMLKRAGWSEGGGLGDVARADALLIPLNTAGQGTETVGLGVTATHEVESTDDEFGQYRKRMMLAYRFRPNPLNNPRRDYY